jgi:hypothetical protein
MKIHYYYDDIFHFAPARSDAAIVWGRSGLNVFDTTWRSFLRRLGARLVGGKVGAGRDAEPMPWRSSPSRALAVEPALDRLRFLYFLANESDGHGADDDLVSSSLTKALDDLDTKGDIRSVAYTGVPPLPVPDRMDRDAVLARVQHMADVVRRWGALHPGSSIDEVALVSNSENLRDWMGASTIAL